MGTEKKMQPSLIHVPVVNDVVYTPKELAVDIVNFFKPDGFCLDPCVGLGAFFDLLPIGSDWCEITAGRDFYAWNAPVDWVVGNPPYSHYSAWMRHSMKIAENILYIMPVYKIFSSGKFIEDLFTWGGIVHIRRYGVGSDWNFPFGHALSAVHYQKGYTGATSWSVYGKQAPTLPYPTLPYPTLPYPTLPWQRKRRCLMTQIKAATLLFYDDNLVLLGEVDVPTDVRIKGTVWLLVDHKMMSLPVVMRATQYVIALEMPALFERRPGRGAVKLKSGFRRIGGV